ncbi:MAG: BRO family protein [Candidatus Paceibacterota bacterium]|jgi:DNA-damage-inducible protein D
MEQTKIAIFNGGKIRKTWHKGEWWYPLKDVATAITETSDPKGYNKDLRARTRNMELLRQWKKIGIPVTTQTKRGPKKFNCANVAGLLFYVEFIPRKEKVKEFKNWLAKNSKEK